MKNTSEINKQNDAGAVPAMQHAGVQVPEGMTSGQTFTHHGRSYVVIEDRTPFGGPDDEPRGLKAVEIAEDIAVAEIVPSPFNRKHFNEARLNEMADSIRKSGQMETAVVRLLPLGHPTGHALMYELVAGERRWRGCKLAGVPVLRCHVRELSDGEAAEQLLLSNLEREDLTPMEEAETYRQLLDLKDAAGRSLYSMDRIAERVFGDAKKSDRVARVLKLLNLPAVMKKALDAGETTIKVAFLVGRIADPKIREQAAKEILKPKHSASPMNFKEAAAYVAENCQVNLKAAPFDLSDATLVAVQIDDQGARIAGGACKDCPHLAKNNPAFEIATGSNRAEGAGGTSGVDALTCTNPVCHEMKLEALWQRKATAIKEKEPEIEIISRKKAEKWFSRWNDGLDYSAPVVLLSAKAGHHTGPTWAKLLKGTAVPVMLACNRQGEAVHVADKALAEASVRATHPALFGGSSRGDEVELSKAEVEKLKKESETSGKTLVALVEKAQKDKAAEARRKQEMEKKIQNEADMDALKELQAAMVKKGVSIEALMILWSRVSGDIYGDVLQNYLGLDDQESQNIEEYPARRNMTTVQLLPLIIVAIMLDDCTYGGVQRAHGYNELAKIYGVSYKDVLARVKKAHELAEKDRIKAEAAKAAAANKRPHKNSSDPSDWTPEGEASKTAAADAAAKGKEELHTCPKCGQANFTTKGLKAHNCAKRVAAKAAEKVSKNQHPGESAEDFKKREAKRIADLRAKKKAGKK